MQSPQVHLNSPVNPMRQSSSSSHGVAASVADDLNNHTEAVKQFSLESFDKRTFIQTEKLKAWFNADSERVDRLLGLAHPGNVSPSLPLRSNELSTSKSYLLIFSILLRLGIGQCIGNFKYNEIYDDKLPISRELIKATLKRGLKGVDDLLIETHTGAFHRKQYAYCPARFEYPHRREYDAAIILPILRKEIISRKGMTAAIWQITVPEEFMSDDLKTKLCQARFDHLDDQLGPRYRLAMKTFSSERKDFYETERSAFDNLFQQSGILRCFGHFDQPDHNGKEWYHLLLEYGQLDLDEFFFERSRPSFPDQVADFWEQMCDIVVALSKLHEFESPREGITDVYHGCHADIKPDNILLVDGVFKIADPGLASFIKKDVQEKLKRRGEKVFVKGGTVTFGAPECHMGNLSDGEVSNKIDIWSLGCVLSLAATWVVLDKVGILDYDTFRRQSLAQHHQCKAINLQQYDADRTQPHADWFHDGRDALPAVRQWHEYLRLASTSQDTLTGDILVLIDQVMLCEEQHRWNAKDISTRMAALIASYRRFYESKFLPTFQSLPVTIKELISARHHEAFTFASPTEDDAQAILARTLEPNEQNPRKERKSSLFQNALLLHHSAAIRTSSLRSSRFFEMEEEGQVQTNIFQAPQENTQLSTPRKTRRKSTLTHSTPVVSPVRSSTSTGFRGTNSRMALPPGKKTIFDLHTEQETRKHRGLMGFFMPKKAHRIKVRDKELAQHFHNRDIHFLVDNGVSMIKLWSRTTTLLHRLVNFVSGQDDDGLDLSFTHGDYKLRKCEDVSRFVQMMEKAAPNPTISTGTDMRAGLDKILTPYIRAAPRVDKNLVIIILTDGKWDGMRDKTLVGDYLVDFYNDLKKRTLSYVQKQIGFGFVLMGEDQEAFDRLHDLDTNLADRRNIPDMIDCTFWDGDVRKMILGSFVELWDGVDEEDGEEEQEEQDQILPDDEEHQRRYMRHNSTGMTRYNNSEV